MNKKKSFKYLNLTHRNNNQLLSFLKLNEGFLQIKKDKI